MKFVGRLFDISNPFTRGTIWKRESFGCFFMGWLIHWGSLLDAIIGIITFRTILTEFGYRFAILHCGKREPKEGEGENN